MSSKLDAIAIESLCNEINELEDSIKDVHVFSDAFERKMREIIFIGNQRETEFNKKKRLESRKYLHISGHKIRRSLLVAIISISILVSTIATIAITKPRFYYVIKENIHNWIIQFESEDTPESPDVSEHQYIPSLPDGYNIIAKDADKVSGYISMKDSIHEITLRQILPENTTVNKNIDKNARHIFIDEYDVIVSEQESDTTFILTTDQFVYILDGNCGYDVLYDMACEILDKK